MRIAIVGSGVSALVAAYHLHRRHEVTIFEKDDRVGGYARTVTLSDHGRDLGLDVGFIVYDERTHPILRDLFAALGVATQGSDMSFSVGCRRCGVEHSSRALRGCLARRAQVPPAQLRTLQDVLRFKREATAALDREMLATTSLSEWVAPRGYSADFARHLLMPMGAAIWSATPEDFGAFPMHYFLRYLRDHGLLENEGQPIWRTVTGGSHEYVRALTRGFAARIRRRAEVTAIRRRQERVELTIRGAGSAGFDQVVIGVRADEALRLLADASDEERRALAGVSYRSTEVVLHTDARWLATGDGVPAAWNVRLEDCERGERSSVVSYDLNRLQQIVSPTQYCVTLNADGRIPSERVLARLSHAHPVYTPRLLDAQLRLRALSGARATWFCGAHLGFGFHEDGARSGFDVARALEAARAAA